MMMVGLIMRPWIELLAFIGGIHCFILADDVLILATGKAMVGYFAKALNCTHKYLQAMGARVAPTKSFNFTNRKQRYGRIGPDGSIYEPKSKSPKISDT